MDESHGRLWSPELQLVLFGAGIQFSLNLTPLGQNVNVSNTLLVFIGSWSVAGSMAAHCYLTPLPAAMSSYVLLDTSFLWDWYSALSIVSEDRAA